MKFKSMQVNKDQKGFTLVELITVIAIVSLVVVYIAVRLSSSNEDAKVALSTTFLLGNVPTALSSYKARHMNSCKSFPDGTDGTNPEELREQLIARGLVATTPWDEEWSASYDHANRRLQIVFPTRGMEAPLTAVTDIMESIHDSPKIDGLTTAANADFATHVPIEVDADENPTYTAPESMDRNGSVQIWYDCI